MMRGEMLGNSHDQAITVIDGAKEVQGMEGIIGWMELKGARAGWDRKLHSYGKREVNMHLFYFLLVEW